MAFQSSTPLKPHLHFHSLSFASLRSISPPYFNRSLRATATATVAASNNDVALLWFKHDLRVDDHPALVTSAQYHSVIPLYIFDHRIISRFSDETLQLVLLALKDLRTSLQEQGSNLMIRFGDAEGILLELVNEVVVSCDKLGLHQVDGIDVFAEEEVEYSLQQMIGSVEECLANMPLSQGRPQLVPWQTPFYDIKNLKKLPGSYSEVKKLKLSPISPLASLELPQLDADLDWGCLPSFDEVRRYYMSVNPCKSNEKWVSVKEISAVSVLTKGKSNQAETVSTIGEGSQKSNSFEDLTNVNTKRTKNGNLKNSVFVSREANIVGGGTCVVLNALAAYLRYLEGTSRDDWKEVHEKLRNAESRSGASFDALFRPAMSLGIISRRRVYYEAIRYERERNGGFLSPFGYSAATVAAAAEAVCSMEWYSLMALKSQTGNEVGGSVRTWRWKDYLVQYTLIGKQGPALLLVHGFGAFLEHYRDNLTPIANNGNRVWALTLLGFGKSEKPNILYTELMWAELLRDFIVDVVGEPVHLVGNSIGGYFCAMVAGIWPVLAKSIVLINTAGSIITSNPSTLVKNERKVSGVAWLGSRALLTYLRLRVGSIVKNCYPSKKERADEWLINEMLRASYDPGVVVVLESVFSFNLSIPLNYLFESFGGKVLIIQGMKDPLSNSDLKLARFREQCSGIEIKELDAGHCPHDERPEEVNSFVCEWITKLGKIPQHF